jgi:alkylresorcinol/alkylpyrone synthase
VRIAAVGTAFPSHYYEQARLLSALEELWSAHHVNQDRLRRLHANVLVGGRHLALPIEAYPELTTWGQANDAWIRVAMEVGEAAIRDALGRIELDAQGIDLILSTSVTGIATPSLDARLMNRLAMRTDTRRLPLFGLGCVAGAAGIARAADHVRAYPRHAALLLSVELCSLTVQRGDISIPNLIASGLFGDGGAAVVVVGDEHPLADAALGPRIAASRSVFYPDTEDVMGWRISEGGFRIVLSADVPKMVQQHLRHDVDAFLADQGLTRDDIRTWICHPGGPKVLEAMAETLALPAGALDLTWRSLREVGNLSSTSVLLVLEETMRHARPEPGSWGVLLAMGPGFCSELVLLRW